MISPGCPTPGWGYYPQLKKLSGGRGKKSPNAPTKVRQCKAGGQPKVANTTPESPSATAGGAGLAAPRTGERGAGGGHERKKTRFKLASQIRRQPGRVWNGPRGPLKAPEHRSSVTIPERTIWERERGGEGRRGRGRDQRGVSLAGWRAGRKSPMHPPKVQIHRRAASRKCKYIGGREGGESFLNCS